MTRASARTEAFITYEGGHVTTRPTSNDPVIMLEQLFKAMDEWTATVRDDPQAYSVTLAPYIIALGPTPPNIAEIENQRDVLIRCAKLRSQTLDKLNLIDYILDPQHMNEFEIIPPPDGPDLSALQAALARDRDVIADAASYTINNIKKACDPETYMREVKGVADFTLTALPINLPKHTGGSLSVPSLIPVPNMVDKPAVAARALLRQSGFVPELLIDKTSESPFVLKQEPAGGTLVNPGSTVRIFSGEPPPGPKRLGRRR